MAPKKHPYAQWAPDARALDIVGDKWTLLIVRDLLAGPLRFVELQRALPGISTEQLRSRLNVMREAGLLTKARYREAPPRVDYELTPMAFDLVPVIATLARWGWTHAAGEPQEGEKQDPRALFRMLPALAYDSGLSLPSHGGAVAMWCDEDRHAYVASPTDDGLVRVKAVPDRLNAEVAASTRISGPGPLWVESISQGVFGSLRIVGNQRSAYEVLHTLAGMPLHVEPTAVAA